MKRFILILLGSCLYFLANAQVTITGSTGADGTYPSLSKAGGAFAALNAAGSQTGKTITISVTGNVSGETGANALNDGDWTSLSITPVGARTVSGSPASMMICLNSTHNVTIDGLNSGGNSLTINNPISAYIDGDTIATLALWGDASNNIVRNCTITGMMRGTVGDATGYAVIFIGGGGTTSGCDNNLFEYNTIKSTNTSNWATMLVNSYGTSATICNDNNVFNHNSFIDCYAVARDCAAMYIGPFSSSWTISNNRFYQSTDRNVVTTQRIRVIQIVAGGGYTITENTIGYKDEAGTSTWVDVGMGCTVMDLTVDPSPVTLIQGNVINGINWTTNVWGDTFYGIKVAAGSVNVIGNTFGSPTGTGTPTSNMYLSSNYVAASNYYVSPITVNSNNSCTISENIIGAVSCVGNNIIPVTFTGISTSGSGNFTVKNNQVGTSETGSIEVGVTGTSAAGCQIVGIRMSSTGSETVGATGEGNVIQNLNVNGPTGYIRGILSNGSISGTNSISDNTINNLYFNESSNNADCMLIDVSDAVVSSTLNIQHNTFGSNIVSHTGTTGGSGNLYGIYVTGTVKYLTIANNVFNSFSLKSTGKVSLIHINYIHPSGGTRDVLNNSINGFTRTVPTSVATSDFYSIFNYSSSASVPANITGNNITGISPNQTGSNHVYGIYSNYGARMNIEQNSFSNFSAGCNNISLIWVAASSASSGQPSLIRNNSISAINCSGSVQETDGIYLTGCSYASLYDNEIEDFNCSIGGVCKGIHINDGPGMNLHDNQITDISNSDTGAVHGIYINNGTGVSVYRNEIHDLSTLGQVNGITVMNGNPVSIYEHQNSGSDNHSIHALTTGGALKSANAIAVMGGTLVHVYRNNLYNISNTSVSGSTAVVNGILVAGGTTLNIHNNTLGNLNASQTSSVDAIRGIAVTSSIASSTVNVYYNTVLLGASSSGTDFGTSALYHKSNAMGTTAALDLRNNILEDNSTPSGTGKACAFRRSGTALNNFSSASNNNIFYAGTPGVSHVIFDDGTNSDQTFSQYKSRVTPRETNSNSENTNFNSTLGSDPDFLHLNPFISTYAESGAVNITSYNLDFDGDIRQGNPGYPGTGTKPDIGADEFGITLSNWNGTISDDWSEPLNWTPVGVPGTFTNVTISTGTPNPCVVKNEGMKCNDLTVQGSSLSVQNAKWLTVGGNLVVN